MNCILFIHSSTDGHLGSFCLLVIMNNAAVKIRIYLYLSLRPCFQLHWVWYTEWELLDHMVILNHMGFLGGSVVKNASQCRSYRRGRFDPWGGKIPWKRKWHLTPVFLPGKFRWTEEPGGLQSMGSQKSQTQLSDWAHTHGNAIDFFFPNVYLFDCIWLSWGMCCGIWASLTAAHRPSCPEACRMPVSWPGIKSESPAL